MIWNDALTVAPTLESVDLQIFLFTIGLGASNFWGYFLRA
jgi:hypothetical protein